MAGVSLLDGWLRFGLLILGVAGFLFLLIRPYRWWWRWVVPATAVVAVAAAWMIGYYAGTNLFSEPLPFAVDVWIAVAIAGVGLAIGHMFVATAWQRTAAVLAAIVVLAAAGNQVNLFYQQYPTLGDLLGVTSDQEISGPPPIDPSSTGPRSAPTRPPGPLTSSWTPTGPDIPADGKGRTSTIDLPGTVSGFPARQGQVYYPPAYFADNAEPLPVVILLPGQPGNTTDWFLGERTQTIMDAFAAGHRGIAPIVVVPDPLGSELANPLCADSTLGNVDTYLAVDVPNGIRQQLRADPDTKRWVIGGFSYGGTCSLQMATLHPDIYPNFLDVSGEVEQQLGSPPETLAAFGGDAEKAKIIQPILQMANKRYPTTEGWFIWGSDDTYIKDSQAQVYQAAKAAGMDVQAWEYVGGGHDWATAAAGLDHAMPWIATQTGLTG